MDFIYGTNIKSYIFGFNCIKIKMYVNNILVLRCF